MNYRRIGFSTVVIGATLLFISGIVILFFVLKRGQDSIKTNANPGNYVNKAGDILGAFVQDNKPFNVLILGGDKVNDNTDTMILVNYDPAPGKSISCQSPGIPGC